MKTKILAALKTLLSSKGFSQKSLEGLADHLVANLTEESTADEINAAIEAIPASTMAAVMQAEINRQVTEAKKPKVETPEPVVPIVPNAPPAKDDTPEWAKALMADMAGLKAEKIATSSKQKFAELIGKDIPESMYKRIQLPEGDDELTALATEIKTEWSTLKQSNANGGLGGDKPSTNFGGAPVTGDVMPAIKEWAASNSPAKAEVK